MQELQLSDVVDYRTFLQQHAEEWHVLDRLCRVTISRFYRDQGLFDFLENKAFPVLAETCNARGGSIISIWSIGCASGEEPYSIAILWKRRLKNRYSGLRINILATDTDRTVLHRAENACYTFSSIKQLPQAWQEEFRRKPNKTYCLANHIKAQVQFQFQDIRKPFCMEPVNLILCRNLIFTYYDKPLQLKLARHLTNTLSPGGFLVLGIHERLPQELTGMFDDPEFPGVYRLKSVDMTAQ